MKNLYKKLQSKLLKKLENMKKPMWDVKTDRGSFIGDSCTLFLLDTLWGKPSFSLSFRPRDFQMKAIRNCRAWQQPTKHTQFFFDTCKNQTPYWYIELIYTFTLRELKTGLAHTDSCNVHSLIHFRSNKVKEVLPVGTDWEIGVRKYLDTSESCMDSQNLTCSPSIKLWGEKLYRVTKVVLWNTELSTTTNLLHSSWLSQQPHPSLHNVKS